MKTSLLRLRSLILNCLTIFVVSTTGPAASANAETPPPWDLGVLESGDIIWVGEDGEPPTVERARPTVLVDPDVPCEVCVSRVVVEQAQIDAETSEKRRKALRVALDDNDALRAENGRLRADLAKANARPGFWSGTGVGFGAALIVVVVLFVAVD